MSHRRLAEVIMMTDKEVKCLVMIFGLFIQMFFCKLHVIHDWNRLWGLQG